MISFSRYSLLKNRLYVTVKSVQSLVSRDTPSNTNPLVRLYLLPDRTKRTRRVTSVLKGTLDGVFNETFEYIVGLDQLRNMKIEATVKSDRGFTIGRARNRLIGTAVVDLYEKALTQGCDISCELRKFSPTSWKVGTEGMEWSSASKEKTAVYFSFKNGKLVKFSSFQSVLIFSILNHPCSFMVYCYLFGVFLFW